MPALQWASYDPKTGQLLEELPGARATGSLTRLAGRTGGTTSLSLPLKTAPDRWELAIQPWRTVIVAYFDDDAQTVAWVGVPVQNVTGSDPSVTVSLIDVETWLGRQPVGNQTFTSTDKVNVARGVGLNLVATNFNGSVVSELMGVTMSKRYRDNQDTRCLAALQELASGLDPIEWYLDWVLVDGKLVARPTVARRIGRAVPVGQPTPFPLSDLTWSETLDYSEGQGSPTVTAVATRSGDSRIAVTRSQSALLAAGLLPGEYRYSPEDGVSTTAAVTSHADAKLAQIATGTRTLSVSVPLVGRNSVLLGQDIGMGDDVDLDLTNAARPKAASLNTTRRVRLTGWVLEPDPNSGEVVRANLVLAGQEGVQ